MITAHAIKIQMLDDIIRIGSSIYCPRVELDLFYSDESRCPKKNMTSEINFVQLFIVATKPVADCVGTIDLFFHQLLSVSATTA